MLGKTYDGQYCSIARSLDVLGERWSLLILRESILSGVTRYNDFQHNLGIATNVLKARLDGFIEAGLMIRNDRGDYEPTEKGRDIYPALLALSEWGDKWNCPDGPPGLFLHADCGQPVHIEIQCPDHDRVSTDEISVAPGPGAPSEWVESRRPVRA